MASIFILLVIIGFIGYGYLKGTVVKSIALLVNCICAGVVAFGYFEVLAGVLIGKDKFVSWAHTLSFLLIFVIVLAILQVIALQILKKKIDLGVLPERIGTVVCGIFLGLVFSGMLLSAFAMAPVSYKFPYQRFEQGNPDVGNPSGILFNADSFATGLFSVMSKGSFSSSRSFALLHPSAIDQAYLNKLNIDNGIAAATKAGAIEVPRTGAVWPASENLKDMQGNTISAKSGCALTIVRIGITDVDMLADITFTPLQMRAICKPKEGDKEPMSGSGTAVYPIGYMKSQGKMQAVRLNEPVVVAREDLTGKKRLIDFVFQVPVKLKPVLVAFKQSAFAAVPAAVSADKAPEVIPFIRAKDCASDIAQLEELSSEVIYGVELSMGRRLLNEFTLQISKAEDLVNIQTPQSISGAKIESDKITYVRAELKIPEPEVQPGTEEEQANQKKIETITGQDIGTLLKTLLRYSLLSLKCNNPAVGKPIEARQLPVLLDISGKAHHSVGVIAKGQIDGETVYEFDYSSLTADDLSEEATEQVETLTIADDGTVSKPFPKRIWLTEKAGEVSEFYVLYMISTRSNTLITSVRSGNSQAKFKKYEGFFVK